MMHRLLRGRAAGLLGAGLLAALLAGPTLAGPQEDFTEGERLYYIGDVPGAMAVLKRAADAGHAPAQAMLGGILDRAEMDEDAVIYYRKAAEQGDPDGELGLGSLYGTGEGVPMDWKLAVVWITKAADKGQRRAIETLSLLYIKGDWGLDAKNRKDEDAVKWIRRAADTGHLPSIDALAAAYQTGDFGLTPDAAQAKLWQDKAKELRRDPAREQQQKGKRR